MSLYYKHYTEENNTRLVRDGGGGGGMGKEVYHFSKFVASGQAHRALAPNIKE